MIDPELKTIVDELNTKYKILMQKQAALKNINKGVMKNAKKFLNLKKSKKVMVTKSGDAIITKDGIMVSKSSTSSTITQSSPDSFCYIDQSYNDSLPSGENSFVNNNNKTIFYGGNEFQYDLNKPCNYFNDIVQPGLDNFEYNSTSFSNVNCKLTNNNMPSTPTIEFNERCKQNHFEICQSMAKLHKNTSKNGNHFGLINDNNNDKCYCYVSDTDASFGTTVEPTDTSHYVTNNNSQMLALMMDGSLMSYNVANIHETHDGVFNEDTNVDGREIIIESNVSTCNKYTGSMPYNYEIEFNVSESKCLMKV